MGILTTPAKWIVAHRGNHSRARENTVEAFEGAIQCGAHMVEFDVRRTLDGELIVHHDADLAGAPICRMTYRDVANWPNYPIPRLAEVLELTSGRIRIDVELKETGYEQDVLREIARRGFPREHFITTSFHVSSVRALIGHATTGLLVEDMSWDAALAAYRGLGPDFLAPQYGIVGGVSDVPLLPWTVNDPFAIQALLQRGDVLGVITDQPEMAI